MKGNVLVQVLFFTTILICYYLQNISASCIHNNFKEWKNGIASAYLKTHECMGHMSNKFPKKRMAMIAVDCCLQLRKVLLLAVLLQLSTFSPLLCIILKMYALPGEVGCNNESRMGSFHKSGN